MRRLLSLILMLTVLTACGGTPTPAPLTHVKLAMGYIPDIQFAPFYTAAEKGYFKEQGIEIEFVTMFENDSVPLVGTNEMQFALVSAEQILQARAQGLPVKYVMKWWDKYPVAIVSKAELGIKSPADLKGRTVGLPGLYGASYIGWQALLNAEGLPQDTAQLESIGFTQAEAVAAGQVDAAVVYANNEPVKLADAGTQVNVIYVADYVQLASNGLATNEQTIKDHPELVRGLVAAALRGMADTIANLDEAVEISKKYVETLAAADEATQATARKVLIASIDMWETANPGISDKARWETTQSVLLNMGLITSPLDVEQAFTNEFVKP
ncbi:MAG TPA: ABC transporter substrate-binding protein [Anaerolineales bacterium]|nr:ABC transporter substrate-binding protein [Anaerolineales bacterium]